MKVKVLYFAAARERTGLGTEELELHEAQAVSALLETLCQRHPRLRELLSALRLAINLEFVGSEAMVTDGDEVALIPPVSGG